MNALLPRILAPIALVALCGAGTAPPAAPALDLPVPAAAGAWSVAFSTPDRAHTYVLDSTGNAATVKVFGSARSLAPVHVSSAAVAQVARVVARADTASWYRATYAAPPYMTTPVQLDPQIDVQQVAEYPPYGQYAITLAWRAADGTVHYSRALWFRDVPNAEPNDVLALAHTMREAFGIAD